MGEEEIMDGYYGGTPTIMNTLDVGTKFHVFNGRWDGEIISEDGVKYIRIDDDRKIKLDDKYTQDINIID
jgi:hypothetical protein